jgi:chaperonin GroES
VQTAGGILLPEAPGSKKNEGEVVAVGPGALNPQGERIPPSVSVGDNVLLPEYGGHTVKLGEEEFLLVRDEDILGVLERA